MDLIREEEKFPFHANVLKDLYMFAVISMKYDVLFCISTILEVLLDLLISCTLLVPPYHTGIQNKNSWHEEYHR